MLSSAEQGYSSARRQTGSPKTIERTLLSAAANQIAAANPSSDAGYRDLAVAINRNTEIWMTLAVDLSTPDNDLPDALRADLLSLAVFVERHGRAVLAREAERDVLVNINRAVAEGLEAAAQQAA